jgi:hypothetical protein
MMESMIDPFAMFGIQRQNWWEGPNVCVERKVLDETEDAALAAEEPVSDEDSTGSRRGGKYFAMDMSFTSCRDDFQYHECTTQVS